MAELPTTPVVSPTAYEPPMIGHCSTARARFAIGVSDLLLKAAGLAPNEEKKFHSEAA
ncbi:MAG: hypothetical protein ABW130_08620 [Candidatus Thiodiazotropha lotti]